MLLWTVMLLKVINQPKLDLNNKILIITHHSQNSPQLTKLIFIVEFSKSEADVSKKVNWSNSIPKKEQEKFSV